jgi:hypothetical protein
MTPETPSTQDTINYRLLELLSPDMRLDFYVLTHSERSLLRAMCRLVELSNYVSHNQGAARHTAYYDHTYTESIKTLAIWAHLSQRTVRNLLNGYTKSGIHRPGLKARGIVSELAPANKGRRTLAVLRINWQAFELNRRQAEFIGNADAGELGKALMKVTAAEA